MAKELTPLIIALKEWRSANHLSQSQAVRFFNSKGFPITLDTLQNWEIGHRSPGAMAGAALARSLKKHPNVKTPPRKRKKR